MTTIATRVIEFLTGLHGMDHLQVGVEEQRYAAIDLQSATIYEVDPEFPDGAILRAELPSGKVVRLHTHAVVEPLLLRHAHAQSISEGANIKAAYAHIKDHFAHKTGFGQ